MYNVAKKSSHFHTYYPQLFTFPYFNLLYNYFKRNLRTVFSL